MPRTFFLPDEQMRLPAPTPVAAPKGRGPPTPALLPTGIYADRGGSAAISGQGAGAAPKPGRSGSTGSVTSSKARKGVGVVGGGGGGGSKGSGARDGDATEQGGKGKGPRWKGAAAKGRAPPAVPPAVAAAVETKGKKKAAISSSSEQWQGGGTEGGGADRRQSGSPAPFSGKVSERFVIQSNGESYSCVKQGFYILFGGFEAIVRTAACSPQFCTASVLCFRGSTSNTVAT